MRARTLYKQPISHLLDALISFRRKSRPRSYSPTETATSRARLENAWKRANQNYFIRKRRLKSNPSESEIDLSIIVPLYNSAALIDDLIDSLVNQITRYTFEILLVDDGSSDETYSVAKSLEIRYPRLITAFHQENSGIASARNLGVEKSRGNYIGFIDHDDRVESNYIETLVAISKHFNVGCALCGYDINEPDGQIVVRKPVKGMYRTCEMDNLYKLGGFVWAGIYRRSMFDKIQFPDGCWYEDIITVPILYRQSDTIVTVDKILYHKYEHGNNAAKVLWRTGNFKCIEQLYLAEDLIGANDALELPLNESLLMSIVNELSAVLWARTRGLGFTMQKHIFLVAADILRKMTEDEDLVLAKGLFSKLGLNDAYYEAFTKRDYTLWLLASLKQAIEK